MRALAGSIRRVAKVSLFASAVVVATLALAQDSRPASAADAEIFFTLSTSSPSPEPVVVLIRDDPDPVTLYVWARNIVGTSGLGAFEVDIGYDSLLMSVNSIAEDRSFDFDGDTVADQNFLEMTGRTMKCSQPVLEPGRANVGCFTHFPPPPFGPQGEGPLATLTVQAFSQYASTTLSFTAGTVLVDTGMISGGTFVEPQEIPAVQQSLPILIARCGDFDGDGTVTLFGDIFAVAFRFGMTDQDPGWNPIYDLNEDGQIDLFNDIFGTAMQFGLVCTQPPP